MYPRVTNNQLSGYLSPPHTWRNNIWVWQQSTISIPFPVMRQIEDGRQDESLSRGYELLHLIRDQTRGLLSYMMHQSHTRTWPQAQIFPAVCPLYGTVQKKCRPSQGAASEKAVSLSVRKLKRWSILKDHRMLRNEKWWDLFLLSSQYVTFPKILNFPDKLTVNKALETVSTRLKT